MAGMSHATFPFATSAVAAAFEAFPASARTGLLQLRSMIFEEAKADARVGALEETLKWGQPSYAAATGTPIRLGVPKSGGFAIYTHCQSRVIPEFRSVFEGAFAFDGNRAVLFDMGEAPIGEPIRHLIRAALTYKIKSA